MLDGFTDIQAAKEIHKKVASLEDPESAVSSLFVWVVGSCGILLPEVEELVLTLQSLHQPVIGVAVGRLDSSALYVVSACDFIYSDHASNVVANSFFNHTQLALACTATADAIGAMTSAQRDALKHDMLQMKLQNADRDGQHDSQKNVACYARSGGMGSCRIPDRRTLDPGNGDVGVDAAQHRRVRFSDSVETIPQPVSFR